MYADGHAAYMAGWRAGMTPDPALWVDDWSEEFQRISPEAGAAEPGKYRVERTPYAREVLRKLSPEDPCRRVVVMGASQMLKTQVALNWMCSLIHMAPGNILALEPSLSVAKRLSDRIEKNIDCVPELRAKVPPARSRDSRNTMDTKQFPGGSLFITTAGSAANLAEVSVRYLYGDEVDRWDGDVGGEGDPVELAEARTTTFGRNAKIYYSSSPTVEEASRIHKLFLDGDQRYYKVACPHCAERQVLEFENLRRSPNDPNAAVYACAHCGALIEEHYKTAMLAGGVWVATAKGDGETVSYCINALYSPLGWLSWAKLLSQHDKASIKLKAGDPSSMQVFYNTRLAKVWSNAQEMTKGSELMARAEAYALRSIPKGVLMLTAAADTQNNRLELLIKGWGLGLENWVIDRQVIMGDPADDATWAALDEALKAEFIHPNGQRMKIAAVAVDSGGGYTQEVYQFCRVRRWRNVFAVKGANKPNRPVIAAVASKVDVNWRGQIEKGGAEMWNIGTDTAKDWIYNRFKLLDGPGAQHFSKDLPDDFYEQLTAERKLVRFVKGRRVEEWVNPGRRRNEILDMSVYNLAMAHYMGLHKYSPADWEKLQMRYAQTGLFDEPPPGAEPDQASSSTPSADPAPAGFVASRPQQPRRQARSGYLKRR
ncbi:phage terminase large subunit family protein [Chromobacterium haemolyticum]|uniref:Phage terminase large subunit family protein n=1 Tax=Chromobacterium fluminis TaxID=3044269 RepID=A0ABX0L8C2_9NEIS|nr:phage terminase large subunit family protein [Chromobacterium haemolyticum]NHR08079.1 phage terminase large subunit family protein [Chromobacterium haemolyticum]